MAKDDNRWNLFFSEKKLKFFLIKARVECDIRQDKAPQFAWCSPIGSWPRIMFSKRVCYNFFNRRHNCHKIECFESSGWQKEFFQSQLSLLIINSSPCSPNLIHVLPSGMARLKNMWSPVAGNAGRGVKIGIFGPKMFQTKACASCFAVSIYLVWALGEKHSKHVLVFLKALWCFEKKLHLHFFLKFQIAATSCAGEPT